MSCNLLHVLVYNDPYLREVRERWFQTGALDHNILNSRDKRENFKTFCHNISMDGNVLKYK